jgi:hypothetical protein
MKKTPPDLPCWTRQRFWGFVLMVFIAQAGLILLFAESGRGISHLASGAVHFHLLPDELTSAQLTKSFFATDPTVFSMPSRKGFSESAWLQSSAPQFDVPDETEPPAWLGVDAIQLGTNFPSLARTNSLQPFKMADQGEVELEQWPPALPPESFSNQSVFELPGELSGRALNVPTNLKSWPSAVLLSNTIVQIAVDASGQVVAARLTGRSGLVDADTNALDWARHLRFRPSATGSPVWGNALFEWQTLEQTNAASTGAP